MATDAFNKLRHFPAACNSEKNPTDVLSGPNTVLDFFGAALQATYVASCRALPSYAVVEV